MAEIAKENPGDVANEDAAENAGESSLSEPQQNDAGGASAAVESIPDEKENQVPQSSSVGNNDDEKGASPKGDEKAAVSKEASSEPPPRPPKRARTAYFIFADTVRPEIQQSHQGVAAQAKAIGAKWQVLGEAEKDKFKQLALKEKEQFVAALAEYEQKFGSSLELEKDATDSSSDLIFPVARIRKIAKLDPEVKTLSKEALQLVVKSAELALSKLGKESVKVARLSNRRTLLADDVAHVCSHREAFLFLKDDIKDLTKAFAEQKKETANTANSGKKDANLAAAAGTKPLTSYFGAVASNK